MINIFTNIILFFITVITMLFFSLSFLMTILFFDMKSYKFQNKKRDIRMFFGGPFILLFSLLTLSLLV